MDSLQPDDLIDKIRFLEERLGLHVSYRILEPFAINPMDPLSLNGAASRIASFLGLKGIFVVNTAGKTERIAGSIEHDAPENASYIEVSRDLLPFPGSVLATIAHELTHAYLRTWNVSLGGSSLQDTYENEILTDICAVFTGLGKLLLNGAQEQFIHTEAVRDGTRQVTETRSVGYLRPGEMAFVYRFVCAARRISPSKFEANLSPSSRRLVQECERRHYSHFDPYVRERVSESKESVQKRIGMIQALAADLTARLTYLDECFIRPALESVRQMHVQAKSTLDLLDAPLTEVFDPVLQFVAAVNEERSLDSLAQQLAGTGTRGTELLRGWNRVASTAAAQIKPTEKPQKQAIPCLDGTPIPLQPLQAQVVCPKCGYRFIAHDLPEYPLPAKKPPIRFPWSKRLNHKAGALPGHP